MNERRTSTGTARLTMCLLVAACTAVIAHVARAQAPESTPAQESSEAAPTPPRLVRFVEATYPPDALADGLEADVTAQIDVDESGAVTAVEIVGSAGHGFDEAAAAAIREFVFEPATRDGTPFPARILYRYRFFQKEAEPASDAGVPEADIPDAATSPATEPEAEPISGSELYETVVRDRKPPREVTRREITQKEILRIPGTGGDALRAVMNMPGTARPAYDNGEIIIRGSRPEDSQIYIDSMPVPLLFHFGGLTSVVNSDLLERIDFYPDNFSVRYGNAIGGVVDATLRAPKTDRLHASIDADFWDASALVETPIGEKWSVAASVRRSYIDGILKHIDTGDMQFSVLPRYWDYQVIADYHPDSVDDVRLTVFGSDDSMVQIWSVSSSDEPALQGKFGMHTGFHRANLMWSHSFNKVVSNRATLGAGYFLVDTGYGGMDSEKYDILPANLRDELTIDPGRFAVFRTGIDAEFMYVRAKDRVPLDYTSEGEQQIPWGANTQFIAFDAQTCFARPGWFGEIELTAIPRFRFITGLRADYYTYTRDIGIDPRAVVRFQLTDTTVLKAGLGLFHEVGQVAEIYEKYGNRDLKLMSAVHYSAGVEQTIADRVDIDVEGFYKTLSRLIVTSDAMIERDGQMVPERFNNDGVGRVYGLELQVKHRPIGPFFGWISYTLMRSERRDHPSEEWRRFDNDQTHILTVVGSVDLPWGMSAGLRFRLVSGNPDTPVEGAVFDSDSDLYVPLYGRPNSARMPLFHQLDLRVDKKWQWKYLAFSVYVDVENVYNHKNAEGYVYNFNYTKKGFIYGMPIIPSLGLRLEY
jgi:TonB family protein